MSRVIKVLVGLVVVLGGAGLIAASYYFAPVIDADQRGVVMTGKTEAGANLTVLAPGKHYWFISGYNPITTTLARIAVSEKELTLSDPDSGENSGLKLTTKEGDTVSADFTTWYRIIPAQAGLCLASVGGGDIDKLVTEITTTTIKERAAYYAAETFLDGQVQTEYLESVKKEVNQQLAERGLELTVFKINKFNFSDALLKKVEEIKKAEAAIAVNKVRVKAAIVAAQEAEEAAKGRKLAALQEAEARKESVIMASEAQITAAKNWVTAETIKAEVMLVRSKAKAEAMQIEATAKVFSGPEGERFLRYRIADSVAEAWAQQNENCGGSAGLDAIAAGINSLSSSSGPQ
ncbi:MAG: SPFH domain-containing protein [Deltaproteobacteria bacterium]|nr:SPFH domain-containing protein [Deltaproteobacteria bacterium]